MVEESGMPTPTGTHLVKGGRKGDGVPISGCIVAADSFHLIVASSGGWLRFGHC